MTCRVHAGVNTDIIWGIPGHPGSPACCSVLYLWHSHGTGTSQRLCLVDAEGPLCESYGSFHAIERMLFQEPVNAVSAVRTL